MTRGSRFIRLLLVPVLVAPAVAAGQPAAAGSGTVTVGVAGAAPSSASYDGPALFGTDDGAGLAGQSAATCTPDACDRQALTLAAPSGYTSTHVVGLTVTITATGGNGSTYDVGIFDATGNLIASNTAGTSPTTVAVGDVTPGAYTIQVDGDVAAGDAFKGVVTATSAPRSTLATLPGGGLSPSRETIADPFRLGTEPNITVSPDGTIYESPIFGFSTTQSFLQRSDDGGQTFHPLGMPGTGKLVASPTPVCTGGGDSDIATTPNNDLYLIDLGGEPSVPAYVSADHGLTFTADCHANDQNGANNFPDRQWLSTDTVHNYEWYIYRDGVGPQLPAPADTFVPQAYGEYFKHAPLSTSPGTAGMSQLQFTSICTTTTGLDTPCIGDVQTAGNAITDNYGPKKGNTYLAEKATGGVGVVVINPDSTPKYKEYLAAPGATNILFPTVAVDRAGNVYEVWSDGATRRIMFSRSSDQGKTWSKPVAINGNPATTAVMPWIVAGDNGRVDVVFYASAKAADPTTNYGPWNIYLAQTLNATAAIPTWNQALMTDRPNHVDPICLSGLGCTTNTGPAGDRELGDFFKVDLDRGGRAVVSFADGNNKLGSEVVNGPLASPSFAHFVRQATGPSLFASVGDVPTIPVPSRSVTVAAHSDPVPYDVPPAGIQGPSNDALNLMTSNLRYDNGKIIVDLLVKNLDPVAATTPPASPVATYITRWTYNGQVYFAAAETAGGQWSYYSGQIAPVTDGLAIKYAYYPASGTATGTVKTGPNGTIHIVVPTDQVGSPPDNATLYSVTSYTWSRSAQAAPVAPTTANFTDYPQVVDVLPAYNFEVAPVPTAAATPSAAPSPSPSAAPLPDTSGGGGGAPLALVVLLVPGALLYLGRHRLEFRRG